VGAGVASGGLVLVAVGCGVNVYVGVDSAGMGVGARGVLV
jgi:hypothetical protein